MDAYLRGAIKEKGLSGVGDQGWQGQQAFAGRDELRYAHPLRTGRMSLSHQLKAEALPPRNAVALDTLAGVRSEMARLYRLGLNGRIPSDELTRFVYVLREIRACIEAELLTDIQQRLALLSREMDHDGHRIAHQPPLAGS